MSSKQGGSRASDEDSKTAVKVGMSAPQARSPAKRASNNSLMQLSASDLRSSQATPVLISSPNDFAVRHAR